VKETEKKKRNRKNIIKKNIGQHITGPAHNKRRVSGADTGRPGRCLAKASEATMRAKLTDRK
jgi:hypothetical protein